MIIIPEADYYLRINGVGSMVTIKNRLFNPITGKYYEIRQRPGFPDGEKKQIYNPVTGRCYEIRQHSGKYTKPGDIKGMWSINKKESS